MTHEHLNDEQLSAHLDGEPAAGPRTAGPLTAGAPDATVATEIDACPSCRARLAALAQARALVRRPVTPVLPSRRAEAVAAALAEGLSTDRDSGQSPVLPSRGKRGRWRSTGLVVGAAAAALVAVVVAVGATHSSTPSASSAASVPNRSAALAPAPSHEKAAAAVPDLGSVNSVQALRSGLSGVSAFSASKDQAKAGENAAGSVAPSSATPAATGAPVATTAPASSPCLTAAPAAAAVRGTPTLLATVTYDHVPALVFTAEGTASSSTASSPRLVVVVARTGCRILARTTL